ncbi:MAG: hypothetical protein Q9165_002531 [Trypethelium subeluteriae]
MGGNPRAVSEARTGNGDGEDGTFDGFLQALQNGRIASALRQGSGNDSEEGAEGANGASAAPLNFFRMFRFGSSNNTTAAGRTDNMSHTRNGSNGGQSTNGDGGNDGSDGRLVPIIIVGIRSITPGSGNGGDDGQMIPPFIDALSNFPTALSTGPNTSIDGVLRPPQRGTHFSHRRRASMGGLNSYDNQRHHRSPERNRPWSTISEASSGPRPPPTTPASPGLSAVSSGTTTPTQSASASAASTAPHSRVPSRRESLISRPPASAMNLTSTAEESSPSSPISPNIARSSPRQRRLSESDFPTRFGSGSSRRNGVVEPLEAAHPPSSPFSRSTNADPSSSTSAANSSANAATPGQNGNGNENRDGNGESGSRSWIIYVLGGSYPENHPILTTPSLFTENPTYEDMLLLSALLGPAKPPVASENDVESAGGLYTIEIRGAETTEAEQAKRRRAEEFEAQMQKSVEEEIRREEEEADLIAASLEKENMSKDADGHVHMVDASSNNDAEQQRAAAADLGLDTKPVGTNGVPNADDTGKAATLVAVADDGSDVISLNLEQRCLVCQYEFERKESVRRLAKCGHIFHRECIDKWLTTGRNSCPLCRGQGVDEKSADPEPGSEDSPTAADDMSPAESSSAVPGAQTEDILTRTMTGEIEVDTEDVVG